MLISSILEKLKQIEPVQKPFSYMSDFVAVNDSDMRAYREFFPVRPAPSPGEKAELGRTIIELDDLKSSDSGDDDVYGFWNQRLSPEITHQLISVLIEKLNPPSSFKQLRWRGALHKYVNIITRRLRLPKRIQMLLHHLPLLADDGWRPVWAPTLKIPYSYCWLFTEDFEGSPLPPHTDSVSKLLTLLIPLSTDSQAQDLNGTSIYKSKHGCRSYPSVRTDRGCFEETFLSTHKEGCFIAFPKSTDTWHGVEPMTIPSGVTRKTLILNVSREFVS